MCLFSNREEELMYLEFISGVTEDILSRGHISDRFVCFTVTVFCELCMNSHRPVKIHLCDF